MERCCRRTSHNYSRLAVRYSVVGALLTTAGSHALGQVIGQVVGQVTGQVIGQAVGQVTGQGIDQKRPAAFVDAATMVPGLIVDMRYAGSHNFVGRRIDGYDAPRCLLTRAAANALAEVARDLAPRGLVLKVFDCYRPTRAVANFVRWARDFADAVGKKEFYPDVDKRTLFQNGYISSRSGHSRGSTVDLTLAQSDGQELDMGTPFDFFSPRSWPAAASISDEAKANRALFAAAMRRRGFRPYEKEWWHFTLSHEPFPDAYFDFPVK